MGEISAFMWLVTPRRLLKWFCDGTGMTVNVFVLFLDAGVSGLMSVTDEHPPMAEISLHPSSGLRDEYRW